MRTTIGVAVLLAALGLLGCGSDEMERGLTVGTEEAAPADDHELEMTEAERQARMNAEEEQDENEAFDREESPR